MKNILIIICIIVIILLIHLYCQKKEKYTFADYDKFPPCWCNRNLDIV